MNSTVSRVTANKYMATPRGIFELKYFFTSADRCRRRRRGAFRRSGAPSHPSTDRRRNRGRRAVRRYHCGKAARRRHRHRAPYGRQIPRSHAHPVLGAAPAREAGGELAARNSRAMRRRVRMRCNITFLRVASFRAALRLRQGPANERFNHAHQAALTFAATFLSLNDALAGGGRRRGQKFAAPDRRQASCLCAFRARTSASAPHCSERITDRVADATSKYFRGGYSGHATVGRDGFGFRTECVLHLDSGASAGGRRHGRRCL